MYSWEIDKLLRTSDFCLDSDTYLYICKNSPQIKNIKYSKDTLEFEINTDDNYHWKIKVYPSEKKRGSYGFNK